ncbi:MAG: sensor histidine kinase, partial [Acidimicrobiales bacterium]
SVGDRVTGRFDAWATPPAVLGAGQAALVERLAREVSGVLHTLHLLDQEREVAERLRDLDQLRSDFMAMVGHDLRSPMAVIAGYVDMMRGKWDEFGDADKLGFLDTIARNTAVLAELVDDVAQVVRLESEEVAPANQPVVVAEVIRQVLDEARVAHPRHHWVAAIDPRLPVVTTDPVSQWRILSNLAGNAARFSPPGSTVEIRATRSSGRLRVSVRDQGAGIAAEDLDKLFQRFSRVTQPGDGPQVKGTGLGLYICRLLVERHGGTIDVQSQAGAGSTFSYTIPLRPRPAGAIT